MSSKNKYYLYHRSFEDFKDIEVFLETIYDKMIDLYWK